MIGVATDGGRQANELRIRKKYIYTALWSPSILALTLGTYASKHNRQFSVRWVPLVWDDARVDRVPCSHFSAQ